MYVVDILCSLFVAFLQVAQAISIPSQAITLTGNLPSLVLPNVVTNVSTPLPPPGFDIDLHFNPAHKLSPLGVYLSAVDCMYKFSLNGWDEEFTGGMTVWANGYPVEIELESSQGEQGPIQLRTSYIILALYDIIMTMSIDTSFFKTVATVFMQRRQIGYVAVQRLTVGFTGNETLNGVATNATMAHFNSNYVAAGSSGRVSDPDDSRFNISYAYAGERINSQDVFLAILDGFATAAEHDADDPFRSLTANSATGRCEIKFSAVEGGSEFNYSFVIKALRIMTWNIIVASKTFGEMTLGLEWEGEMFAEGSIRAVTHGEERTARMEVAR